MKRNFGALVLGIGLLLLGGMYLGNAFGWWDLTLFFDGWWALFLMVPALYMMFSSRPDWFNVGLFLLGGYFLLKEQPWFEENVDPKALAAGGVFLYIGVLMIVHFVRRPRWNKENFHTGTGNGYQAPKFRMNGQADFNDYPTYTAIMSGVEQQNACKNLKGGKLTAVMGGIDLDFRQAQVQEDITIYVTAVMGGVDIYAPQNCKIAMHASNFLGGTDNHALSLPEDAIAPTVTFVCTTVMGGIDIY